MGEVWLDVSSRLGRTLLTALGTVIGIAVLVSTVGLANSASARIVTRFDALAATELTVKPSAAGSAAGETSRAESGPDGGPLPFDAPARLAAIDGVVTSATVSEITTVESLRGTPVVDPAATPLNGIGVFALSADFERTVHASLRGRAFDRFHDQRGEPVAILGASAARRLDVSAVDQQPVIFIDDRPVVVLGILTAVDRKPELLDAVIVPDGYARAHLGLTSPGQLLVETRVGAAEVVGRQAAIAIRPDLPGLLSVVVPPTPTLTRDHVADDTSALLLVLALISLLIGGVGIANVTLVSVLERVPEVGLRRALGARRAHVVGQFLLESTLIGLLGGVAGTAIGVLVTVVGAWLRDWPATMDPRLPFAAPMVGAVIGLVAGLYPAWRAGRIEPIQALRAG